MYLLLGADQRPKQNHEDVLLPCLLIYKNCVHWRKDLETDIEPQDYSSVDFSVSKQLGTLLRHGSLPREEDGAIEVWRLKDYLRNHYDTNQHWSGEQWKSTMAKEKI